MKTGKFDYTINSPVKIGNADDDKTIWVNLGVAFKNKDGSISCNLNGLPVNGKLVLFIPKEKEEQTNFRK
jgi:hypothetical protein